MTLQAQDDLAEIAADFFCHITLYSFRVRSVVSMSTLLGFHG